MSKTAAMFGSYVDAKFLRGLKVMRVSLEIPIEKSAEFFEMFGTPPANGTQVPVAIARLATTPAEQPSGAQAPSTQAVEGQDRPQRTYTRSQLAAIKCSDPVFQKWIAGKSSRTVVSGNTPAGTADAQLKDILMIGSKRLLDTPGSRADEFDRLIATFDAETKWGVK